MKKVIFSFLSVLLLFNWSCNENDDSNLSSTINFTESKYVKSSKQIRPDNPIIKKINTFDNEILSKDLSSLNKKIQVVDLSFSTDVKLISFSNEDNTVSTAYLYNFTKNEYVKYLVKFDKKNIVKVFDENKNLLYSVNINTKYINLNNATIASKQSCFGS